MFKVDGNEVDVFRYYDRMWRVEAHEFNRKQKGKDVQADELAFYKKYISQEVDEEDEMKKQVWDEQLRKK